MQHYRIVVLNAAGNLAFPKGLSSAAGRPRVPPSSPVVFDVELLFVPGKIAYTMR